MIEKGVFMKSSQEWFSAKELEGINGLPSLATNITRKALKEGWIKREKKGTQGGGFEFHYSSLPEKVQKSLNIETKPDNKTNVNLLPDAKKEEQHTNTLVSIPFFHAFASAGFGSVNTSVALPDDYIGLSSQWLWQRGLHRNNLVFLLTSGDSMEPTIHNRDMLLIDRSSIQPRDGEIYVIRVGDQLWVKRIQGLINGIRLISDNRDLYEPIDVIFDESTNVEILGRVVFVGHSFL